MNKIWDSTESVSECFPTYSHISLAKYYCVFAYNTFEIVTAVLRIFFKF